MILTIDGLNVHFQAFGQGPPLVVLHGWGDSSANWYSVAERLSGRHQVFLLDLPGFGGSDEPAEPWGVEDYVGVVERFIEEMELDEPVFVGHSHGGKVACRYASKQNPCKGLVLIASSGVDRKTLDTVLKIYVYKAIKQILLRCGEPGERLLDALRGRVGSTDYRQAGAMRGTLVRVVNEKLFELLPSIQVPVLILWGSDDKTLAVKQAKIFRRLLPDAYIRILWGASHHPHIDAPEELAGYIEQFCSGL